MRMKRYTLAATLLVVGTLATAQTGCSTKTCSTIALSYEVSIDRELDAPFRDAAQLSVELCGVDAGCRTATVSPVTRELVGDVRGAMVASDQGRTRVHVTASVVEGTVSLTLRVRDKNGNLLLDSRAPLQWKSDECTREPVTTAI